MLGSGAEGSPLVAEDQERFLVLGLVGRGWGREVPRSWIDMALPYRGSLFGGG